MSRIGEKALKKLLLRAEKQKYSSKRVTLKFTQSSFSPYPAIKDKEVLDKVHAYLENAQRHQAIIIDWQTNRVGIQIDRITLGTVNELASYLGVATLQERIAQADNDLNPMLIDAPAWLVSLYQDFIQHKWEQAGKAFGLAPEDSRLLSDLIKLITHLEKHGTQDLDRHSLSVRLFHDSKYIEKSLENLVCNFSKKIYY